MPILIRRRPNWRRPRGLGLGLSFALLAMQWAGPLRAEKKPSAEYRIKAAFLSRFAQFVEWPENEMPESGSPLVIGVFGEDPFGDYLDEFLRGETVKEHRLRPRRFRRVDQIDECHVLFISAAEKRSLPRILGGLNGRPILTVSDVEGFAESGGMILLFEEDNKIRFRINVEAARAAGLSISSKLLRLARSEPSEGG